MGVQTDVDVCNLALAMVGAEPIDALDDSTPASAYCQVNYPQCRDWLLGLYRWSFANRVAQLDQLAETPDTCPRLYAYKPPSDLIGVINDYRSAANRSQSLRTGAELNDGNVCADITPLYAEYTARVAESTWPVWFTQLVATALAMGIAAGPLKSATQAQALRVQVFGTPSEAGEGGLYAQARAADSRAAPQRQAFAGWDDGALVRARFHGWPGYGGGDPWVIPPGAIGPIEFIDF